MAPISYGHPKSTKDPRRPRRHDRGAPDGRKAGGPRSRPKDGMQAASKPSMSGRRKKPSPMIASPTATLPHFQAVNFRRPQDCSRCPPATGPAALRPVPRYPAVRPVPRYPAVRPVARYPAVRPVARYPAVRPVAGCRTPYVHRDPRGCGILYRARQVGGPE